MRSERKLAMPDRAADGQFSCDTGLSRPVSSQLRRDGSGRIVCSAMRLDAVRSFSSTELLRERGQERAGIDNESDQVP